MSSSSTERGSPARAVRRATFDEEGQEGGLGLRVAQAAARLQSDVTLSILDAVLVAASYAAVLLLRFDGIVPVDWWSDFRFFLPLAMVVHLLANAFFGLYGQMWRHASIMEARQILVAGASGTGLLSILVLAGPRLVPVSVAVLGGVVVTAMIGLVRFQSRLFATKRRQRDGRRVLVVGVGEAGAALIREMDRDASGGFFPVVALDDDTSQHGRRIGPVPIAGPLDDLPDVSVRYDVDLVLLAIPSADAELVRHVAKLADEVGITVKTLPSVSELLDGEVSMRDVRDLEITDLLGRQPVDTDLDEVGELLAGKRVLVTGAGGSIGSEIARQVLRFGPSTLVLLDHDETHLHDVAAGIDGPCSQALVDVRLRTEVHEAFQRYQPDVVFHAAAHKHVPLLERHPREAAATNVFGTRNVMEAADAVGTERFVLISTDKAVRPQSVMGASKRVAEQLLLSGSDRSGAWCAVRFGNVLGSRGSVVPTFMRQIEGGGPVTVTHPDITRFFMSIPEAVQLVLQAAAMARDNEVFMLDMGSPVRIVDLATRMIRLSGGEPGVDVEIEMTGLRPGEKLAEELQGPDEQVEPTSHAKIMAVRSPSIDRRSLEERVQELWRAVVDRDDDSAVTLLFDLAGVERRHLGRRQDVPRHGHASQGHGVPSSRP